MAESPFGYHSYVYPSGWQAGVKRALVYPLAGVSSLPVLSRTLPAGHYVFHFAVDDDADGVLDATWRAAAEVEVL